MADTNLQPNKDHYAIVIGINGYMQLRPLKSANRDATRFAEWLASPEGGNLPSDNIKMILSPDPIPINMDPILAAPQQIHIDQKMRDIGFERNTKIGQRLYFYFSGHGFGPQFYDVCMLMANASIGRLKLNIGLMPYMSYIHEHNLFDEIIFILDCCRDRKPHVTPVEPVFSFEKADTLGEIKDFVILAAEYGEKAFEPKNPITGEGRGLLTQALLEGLKDPAAADHRGRVTNILLSKYLAKRLPKMAGEKKLQQAPEFFPDSITKEIVISHIPVDQLSGVNVQVTAKAGLTGDIMLFAGGDLTNPVDQYPAEHATLEAPWKIVLRHNTIYQLRHDGSGFKKIINTQEITNEPNIIQIPEPFVL